MSTSNIYILLICSQGPVVIVPTKYYQTPTQHFRDMGVSMVIWANHNLRASITAIQETTATIYKDQSLVAIENNVSVLIASIKICFEVFWIFSSLKTFWKITHKNLLLLTTRLYVKEKYVAFLNLVQKTEMLIRNKSHLQVASVKEVFRLQRDSELVKAEDVYLPQK